MRKKEYKNFSDDRAVGGNPVEIQGKRKLFSIPVSDSFMIIHDGIQGRKEKSFSDSGCDPIRKTQEEKKKLFSDPDAVPVVACVRVCIG